MLIDKIKYTILFQFFCKVKDVELVSKLYKESKDVSNKLELGEKFDKILDNINDMKSNPKELKRYIIDNMFDYEDEKEICGED